MNQNSDNARPHRRQKPTTVNENPFQNKVIYEGVRLRTLCRINGDILFSIVVIVMMNILPEDLASEATRTGPDLRRAH